MRMSSMCVCGTYLELLICSKSSSSRCCFQLLFGEFAIVAIDGYVKGNFQNLEVCLSLGWQALENPGVAGESRARGPLQSFSRALNHVLQEFTSSAKWQKKSKIPYMKLLDRCADYFPFTEILCREFQRLSADERVLKLLQPTTFGGPSALEILVLSRVYSGYACAISGSFTALCPIFYPFWPG